MEELKIGDIIKQRYVLVKFLGSGSFGEVWLAHDQMTDRDVALKIYLSLDPAGVEEFQREYANSIGLSSPYLLTPEYFDIHNRRPFLVMKFCENGSSSKLAGQISEDKLWAFIHDVASGLEILHSQSDPIVHQDIKPDNILIDSTGRFLITDFGISKRLRATLCRQSKRDVSSGAMPYMAPERFDSKPRLSTASDIWSLGASIYELATGELPFSGFGGAMQRNGADMPFVSGYSSQLNTLMQECLCPDVQNRPNATKIKQWASNKSVDKTQNGQPPIKKITSTSENNIKHTPVETNLQKKSSSYWPGIVIGILILGVIGFFISNDYNNHKTNIAESVEEIPSDSCLSGVIASSEDESQKEESTEIMSLDNTRTQDISSDMTCTQFRLGEGSISVPSFMSYKGESDDGGPMFFDETGQIRLYAEYSKDQELELYHQWTTSEIGNGSPVYDYSTDNYFVQSGYTYNGEVYYAKAYMDYNIYPPFLYTATLIYPTSQKRFVDKWIPLIFDKFPNTK